MKRSWDIENFIARIRSDRDLENKELSFETEVYESCVPSMFFRVADSDVQHNRPVWEKLIQPYVTNLKYARKTGASLYFEGDNGTGKTMFMCYVLMEAMRKNYNAYYTTVPDLISDLQISFSDPGFRSELEDELLYSDFLGLDELGRESFKDGDTWSTVQINRILKYRSERHLPTIVATNANLEQVTNLYGHATESVLTGYLYRTAMFSPGDYRKKLIGTLDEGMGYVID